MTTDIEKQIIQAELDGLYQLKLQLVKKRNALQLSEVNQSDANQGFGTDEALDKIRKQIEDTDIRINDLKNQLESEVSPESPIISGLPIVTDEEEDIGSKAIEELLNQEAKELDYTSTKEDITRVLNLKKKVHEKYFKNLDNQLNFVTSQKELMYSSALFDTIYTSEKLDEVIAGEIRKIRENNESYKWYDRSVIVSALSLSLINFNFDVKKANLLLDFVTDFEPQVWERALTGIILGIGYQKNRSWMRAVNFINRLEALQKNGEVQNGLKAIDFILENELYKTNIFNPNLFKMDLFKNPMNCFLPFYENNKVLKNALGNASTDFDTDKFQNYLENMPIMDAHKYALCVALSENELQKGKLNNDEALTRVSSLIISHALSPFQNLISEYFQFFNYFPEKFVENIFKKQLIIAETPLKRYIFNKEMKLLVEANTLFRKEKYSEAIVKYKQLLSINQSNTEASLHLATCYHLEGEYKKALSIYLNLEKKGIVTEGLEYKIARCYTALKQYRKSNIYCKKIIEDITNPSFKILHLISYNYSELDDFENAEIYCKKALENAVNEEDYSKVAARFNKIKKHEDALNIIRKVVKTKTDVAGYWETLGDTYMYLYRWNLSIEALEKASKLDKKDINIQLSCGRVYLFSKTDITKAIEIFQAILKKDKGNNAALSYGNLGHLYMVEKKNEEAFENYLKCINILKDEKDFKKRMNSDVELIINAGVSEQDYNSMRDRVVEKYLSTKKK